MRQRSPARFMAAAAIFVSLGLIACGGGDGGDATAVPTSSGAITIDAPADGAEVQVPFAVAGTANVFEGALVVQAIDAAGEVLCQHNVQASAGSGTRGTWETAFAFVPPTQEQQITIKAFSLSARDGAEENVVTRTSAVSKELPPIVIESPGCNYNQYTAAVLNVSGTASVFEAALIVEVRDADGTVLKTKVVTASAAAPARGTWQVSLDVLSLSPGPFEVVAYSISARDGTAENIFSVPIRRNG